MHHGTPAHLAVVADAAGATGAPATAARRMAHADGAGGADRHAEPSAPGHRHGEGDEEPGTHDPGTCRLYDALACVDLAPGGMPGAVPAPAEPPRVGIDPVAPFAVQATGFLARGPPSRS